MTKYYETRDYSSNYSRRLIRGDVKGNLGINSAVRFSAIYGEGVDRLQVLRTLQKENTFKFWWYLIFGLSAIVCLIIDPSSWLSVIELFVLMVNIDLVSRGNVIGIYIGILDCLIYIVICYLSGLWGEIFKMMLINIPLNIVSIISWTKNLKKQNQGTYSKKSIEIKRLSTKGWLIWISVFLVVATVAFFILRLDKTTAIITVIISALSLGIGVLSKVLNGQRYMEAYIFSIVGNVVSMMLWTATLITAFSGDAVVQVILYLASFFNNVYGFILWKNMYRTKNVNGGKILSMRKIKISRVIKLRRMYKNLYWDKKVDILKNS